MIATVYEIATRRILYSVSGARAPTLLPAGAAVLEGIEGDGRTQRVTADLLGVEPLPEVAVTIATLTPTAGASVAIGCASPLFVVAGGERVGQLPAGGGTLSFDTPGTYAVSFRPPDPAAALGVAAERTFTVGAAAGAPEATTLVVGEHPGSMLDDLRARLGNIDAGIDAATQGATNAEAVRTAAMSTAAQAIVQLRELARIVRVAETQRAAELRHIRRAIFALVDLSKRRG